MALRNIVTLPDPMLKRKAHAVTKFDKNLQSLLNDMVETMRDAPGVGLAAPQVGDPRRIVVIDSGEGDGRGKRLLKMVNPTIVERSKDRILWDETCLSVPDMEVTVERNRRIRVEWRDGSGGAHSAWFEEYEAVIVQHELDHLLGTVLLDRVSAFRRARYLKKRKKVRELEPAY